MTPLGAGIMTGGQWAQTESSIVEVLIKTLD